MTPIKDLLYEVDNVTIEGMIFGIDMFEAKSGYKIITLKVTDNNDSIYVKMFTKDDEEYSLIKKLLKEGKWYIFYGKASMDKYANEIVFTTRYRDVEEIDAPVKEKIEDNEEVKRVELHAHTMMSMMDSVVDAKKLVKDIMTSEVVTIKENTPSEEALDIAYENKVERLPVVRDGKLVGIITIKDILNRSQ